MSSSNVSAVTNLFPTVNEGFITTLNSSIGSGATTVPLAGVSGLTDGSIFVGIIEPGQTKEQTFTGTVDSGGAQITGVKWTRNTNTTHTAGVTIVDYVSGTGINMISRGLQVSLKQDGTLNNGAISSIAMLASAIQDIMHPVGSVYVTTVATNPNTLFGFGTWAAFGTGRTLVGIDAAQTEFDTIEETGGEKTHVLSVGEMAAHNHTGTTDAGGGHSHSVNLGYYSEGSGGNGAGFEDRSAGFIGNVSFNTDAVGNHTHTFTSSTVGSNAAHNNLQPYIVVYMWKRTA